MAEKDGLSRRWNINFFGYDVGLVALSIAIAVLAAEIEGSVRSSIESAEQPDDFQFTKTHSKLAAFKVA